MKSQIKSMLIVLLLVFKCITAFGQPNTLFQKKIFFEQLPPELGLSQRTINCILQDKEGFLWIGTWSGLLKYDGYSTTLYTADYAKPDQLKSNKIAYLYESSDSTIWVGTVIGGLFKFDKSTEKFTQYKNDPANPHSISNNSIMGIVEDEHKNLWVATENGLNRLDRKTGRFESWFHSDTDPNSLSVSHTRYIHMDKKGQLWVATEYGLNLIEDPLQSHLTFKRYYYQSEENYLDNYIFDIKSIEVEGKLLTIWVTKSGIKILDGDKISNYTAKDVLPSFSFYRCLEVVDGTVPIVLAGSEMGLSVFDLTKREFKKFYGNYDKDVNLSQNTITSLFLDRAGVLWIGTRKGINKYDTYSNNFRLYLTKNFDPTNSIITGLVEDGNGRVWLSTMGGGLFEIANIGKPDIEVNHFKIVTGEEVDFTEYIQKLAVDVKGNIWVGTAGSGIYVFDSDNAMPTNQNIYKHKHFNVYAKDGVLDNYVMAMEPRNNGGMWVGTWSYGLNMIDEKDHLFKIEHTIPIKAPIVSIYEEKQDVIWLGTRGDGVYHAFFNKNELLNFQNFEYSETKNSLSNDFVSTIIQDHQGHIWVGTEDGLNRYDESSQTFKSIKKGQGLPVVEVVGVIEDELDRFWVSHNQGITVMNPYDSVDLLINNFGVKDRIQGGFFYNEVLLKDSKGRMYFGGSNGLSIIDSKDIFINPNLPKTIIQKFLIDNREVEVNQEINGKIVLKKKLSDTKNIVLDYNQNSFSFEFTALHFAIPEKNQFAYKLEGFDEDWNYTSADRRFANYTNMEEKDYVFKVKSANNDGLWEEKGVAVQITVSPPWWKTKKAIFVYMIIGVVLLLVFRRLILLRLQYENDLEMARLEKRNTELLNKSKLQFFTNISHEFRTPLTLILGPLENILNNEELNVSVQRQLNLMSQNASRLLRLINQLLDFRKADAGNLALRVAEGNIFKFLKEIRLSFEGYAVEKMIELDLKSTSNVVKVYFDRDQFEKIIVNLLSNAFKHTAKGGKIEMVLLDNEASITIRIKDNGSGIKEENLSRVFDRFYSGENTTASSGIGLALSKSLVELHHGTITVSSEINEFTQFELTIPKGKDHFKADEIIHDFRDSENIENYHVAIDLDLSNEHKKQVAKYPDDISTLKRILIVEDNHQLREFLKSIFAYEYIVLEADNGLNGMNVALEENPDIVISDVMMPIMDGFTLCAKLKKDINTSHIPIVLLTARTSLVHNIEGLDKGADDYITKPFNIEVLKLKVRNLIRSREQLRQIVQSKTELVIEPKKVTVTSADELFVEKSLDIIEENMSNSEYSVVEFGKEIGFSRMQLYRKLKSLTGLSPNEYIRMIRVKRAAQLLESSDLNITEITYKIGFSDPSYFRRCFKEQFNETPSSYAKKFRKNDI